MKDPTVLVMSLRAAALLAPGATGRVLACFERACYLATAAGGIVVLVWDGLGPGPLNIVLDRPLPVPLPPDAAFTVSRDRVLIQSQAGRDGASDPFAETSPGDHPDPVRVTLAGAARWDARPDWVTLEGRLQAISGCAARLSGALPSPPPGAEGAFAACRAHGSALLSAGPRAPASRPIAGLVGLGPGLTPMGDDWLAGWLLSLRLHPDGSATEAAGRLVLAAAEAGTNRISRAFLACAAAGEADHNWHVLLDRMARGCTDAETPAELLAAAGAILSQGATSGLAMMSGFLLGLGVLPPNP